MCRPVIGVDHLHWSAEFVRRNPRIRFFAELLGILPGESFPPKKIVHHIPLGISSTGESILAREFPGEFMNYHDYGMPLFASHTGSRRISGGGPVVDSTCAAAIVAGATGLRA